MEHPATEKARYSPREEDSFPAFLILLIMFLPALTTLCIIASLGS